MSKLAGRMTYLGFGLLAGVSLCAAYFRHASSDIDLGITLQILASLAAAFASAMSALSATKAATITEAMQRREEARTKARISTAKRAVKEARALFADETHPANESRTFNYIEGLELPNRMIELALQEPMSEDEYTALMFAQDKITQMIKIHTKEGKLKPSEIELANQMLTAALKLLNTAKAT